MIKIMILDTIGSVCKCKENIVYVLLNHCCLKYCYSPLNISLPILLYSAKAIQRNNLFLNLRIYLQKYTYFMVLLILQRHLKNLNKCCIFYMI